jgi:multisubunit Na+/H+ antiporter MnhB subunit
MNNQNEQWVYDKHTKRWCKCARDEQTGNWFEIVPEENLDTAFAIVSYVYLFLAFGFFLWLLFDTWARKYTFALLIGYSTAESQSLLNSQIFRSFAYAFIGGALGGVIAGYRSCVYWHSEKRAFCWRYLWKYLCFPWLGATLALVVYAIIGSGVAIIGGSVNFGTDTAGVTRMMSALAIGSLVGYGSPQVVKWLDNQVNILFKVVETPPKVETAPKKK